MVIVSISDNRKLGTELQLNVYTFQQKKAAEPGFAFLLVAMNLLK